MTSRAIPHWYDPEIPHIDVVDGEGAHVIDADGNEYLDFLSQLYCCHAGHSNEAIIEAIEEQLRRIPYVAPAQHSEVRSELAAELGRVAPGSLSDVYFSVTGSEANEAAAQIARKVSDGYKILTRWESYHGSTYGAASFTGDPQTREAIEKEAAVTGSEKFLPPRHTAFDADSPEELAKRAADHVEYVIQNEGPETVAAILMEPVGGASGAYTAPPGYFKRLREICDEYDVLFIADEVITGFGRCGEMFGIQTENVTPDMITFAKGVTSAYVPLAGVIVDEWIGDQLLTEGHDVGQTFAGHPVGCAAGVAAVTQYENELIDAVNEHTPHVEERLETIEATYDVVSDVRGRGLFRSIEFADPDTGEPFHHPWFDDGPNPMDELRAEAAQRGALFGFGRPDIQLIVAPPFCVSADEIDQAFDALETSIEAVFQ